MTTPGNNTAPADRYRASHRRGRPSTDIPNGTPGHSLITDQPGPHSVPGTSRAARGTGPGLLTAASCLLLLLAAAQGYVSFRAQYTFVDHAKHARLPSMLEALGLDTGAVIFALLALSLARHGSRAAVERTLNLACAVGSLTMNLLAANLASPRSVTVWVLPSALYALASDRLIAVVRRWVQATSPTSGTAPEGSAWHAAGGLALWLLRLVLDAPGTATGFRRWVLAAAPVVPGLRPMLPAAEPRAGAGRDAPSGLPGPAAADDPATQARRPAGDELAPGETKRAALIRLYEHCGATGDPRYGDRGRAAAVAGEIAGRIGYHPGTARRELVRYLASRNDLLDRFGAETPAGTEARA
ncbi:MAG: hypothetical protein ACRDNF_25415 [Streptosporangiaceae bacterium]